MNLTSSRRTAFTFSAVTRDKLSLKLVSPVSYILMNGYEEALLGERRFEVWWALIVVWDLGGGGGYSVIDYAVVWEASSKKSSARTASLLSCLRFIWVIHTTPAASTHQTRRSGLELIIYSKMAAQRMPFPFCSFFPFWGCVWFLCRLLFKRLVALGPASPKDVLRMKESCVSHQKDPEL